MIKQLILLLCVVSLCRTEKAFHDFFEGFLLNSSNRTICPQCLNTQEFDIAYAKLKYSIFGEKDVSNAILQLFELFTDVQKNCPNLNETMTDYMSRITTLFGKLNDTAFLFEFALTFGDYLNSSLIVYNEENEKAQLTCNCMPCTHLM